MSIKVGSKVQSVDSRLGLMADGDTTIVGTVRSILPRGGGMAEVYWPTTQEITYDYGNSLYLVAGPLPSD